MFSANSKASAYRQITSNVAAAPSVRPPVKPLTLAGPIEILVEHAWNGLADRLAAVPGVRRNHARIVSWTIDDPRDIYTWPSDQWNPPH